MIRWRRFALLTCAVLAIFAVGVSGGPLVAAQQAPAIAAIEQQPTFEVATIKPSKPDDSNHNWDDSAGRLSIENFTIRQIIREAYGLKSDSQVVGGPKWIDTERFDIVAKADDEETLKMQKMNREEWVNTRILMLQSLLTDRFELKAVRSFQRRPVYALVVARSGIKFIPSPPDEKNHGLSVRNNAMTASGISMDSFADYLSRQREIGDRVVINRTGLSGEYDFKLNWTHDRGNGVPPDAAYPGLFTALQEQLGLKLESKKSSVDVVIVDAATEPAMD